MDMTKTTKFATSVTALVLLLLCPPSPIRAASHGDQIIEMIYDASTALSVIDFLSIQFQAGRPRVGDSLDISLKEPVGESLHLLEENAHVITHNPNLTIELVGFTDSQECKLAECGELSRRRANLIYDWLLANGVPNTQLMKSEGKGQDDPVDFNQSEQGRQRNRRVEFFNRT